LLSTSDTGFPVAISRYLFILENTVGVYQKMGGKKLPKYGKNFEKLEKLFTQK
jgi:hypothetical protein